MEDLRYFHSTVVKTESQQGWGLFLCKSNKNQGAGDTVDVAIHLSRTPPALPGTVRQDGVRLLTY